MQALIAVKDYIAAKSQKDNKNKSTRHVQLPVLTEQLINEMITTFPNASGKKMHIHIYQRALQKLLVMTPGSQHTVLITQSIACIKEMFPAYFNWDEPTVCSSNLKTKFKNSITATEFTDPLLHQLTDVLYKKMEHDYCSWKQLQVIEMLLHEKNLNTIDPLQICIENNLNCTHIRTLLCNYFQQQLHQSNDALQSLYILTNRISQYNCSGYFMQHENELQAYLLNWLHEELQSLQTIHKTSFAGQSNTAAIPAINTSLSVSQFAALLRLLTETKIITCKNQRQLLSFIASHTRTANATVISPQSFRNKFYVPEVNTLTSLKDVCITLLNQVRKMAG